MGSGQRKKEDRGMQQIENFKRIGGDKNAGEGILLRTRQRGRVEVGYGKERYVSEQIS